MGVNLIMLPFDGRDFSHTMLRCEEWSDLWELMQTTLRGRDVPSEFQSYCSDDGARGTYGTTSVDGYGDPLKYVQARDLLRFSNHEGVLQTRRNRAVWGYVAALPDEHKIALYWC